MSANPVLIPNTPTTAEPSSLDAEYDVIGAILIDSGVLTRISHKLPVEAFYAHQHRIIYQACLDLHAEDHVVDLISLTTALADAKQLKRVGGKAAISGLFDACLTSANVDSHVELIVEKHQRRCMARLGAEIQRMASDSQQSIKASLSAIEEQYRELLGLTVTANSIKHISDITTAIYDRIDRASQGEIDTGIPTGFYDLDSIIGGIQAGELVILAGRPGMAKTSAVTNIVANVAAGGYGGYVASLEMSAESLGYRMISADVSVESGRLRSGRVGQTEWEPLGHSISKLSRFPVWFDDSAEQTVAQMSANIQRLQAENGKDSISIVMVDYIQLMGVGEGNRAQELAKISRSLKVMARKLNVSVWVLAQINRGVEGRTEKRPVMSDIKDSGGIEQDADKIIMLYRDEYYDENSPDKGVAEWSVVKHRNGPTGTAKLLFEGQYTRFRNLAPSIG